MVRAELALWAIQYYHRELSMILSIVLKGLNLRAEMYYARYFQIMIFFVHRNLIRNDGFYKIKIVIFLGLITRPYYIRHTHFIQR